MVTKRLYLQIGAQKKARFFSLMYFCESFCINRISHNYVIPQFVFCIIMPFRTSFHMPFRKLIPPFTLTGEKYSLNIFFLVFTIIIASAVYSFPRCFKASLRRRSIHVPNIFRCKELKCASVQEYAFHCIFRVLFASFNKIDYAKKIKIINNTDVLI